MIDRRSLFAATTAAGSFLAAVFGSRKAKASDHSSAPMSLFEGDVEKRGTDERLERLPKLDLESYDDFLTGFRVWSGGGSRGARERFGKLLSSSGLDPNSDLPLERIFQAVENDTFLGTVARSRTSSQALMWKALQLHFHQNADLYLEEMESTDNRGPGKLELNPGMEIPQYASYEIHIQPGGYVGDPFAGHIYHYGTNNFYRGMNYQDEIQRKLADQMAVPKDKKVLRILDMGCGVGQLTAALKERFPDAEVWGVDVGGPMVRYGHMRCVDLGIAANFRQALAEQTNFEDNYFDIVTSYILHHEVPEQKSREIIQEAYRVLRPGGVFFPIDFQTGSGRSQFQNRRSQQAYTKYSHWKDHRWNEEVWRIEYRDMDFNGAMREIGFDVLEKGPPAWRSRYNVLGTKPV